MRGRKPSDILGKEQLYLQNIEEPDFIMVLEKNLKVYYEAAKRQGFEIWNTNMSNLI